MKGIKYVQTKLVTKKLRDQISTRRKSVTQLELERKREENNLIISELKSHIQTLKNRINELQEEKKNQITTLKRELLLTKQQLSSPDLKTLQASTLSFSSSSSTLPDSSFIESNNQLSISPESEWLEIIKFSNLEIERLNGIIQKQELEMNEMKKRTEFLEKELLLHQTRQHTEIQLLTQKLESEVRSKEVLLQNNKELEEQIRLLRIQNPQEKIDQSSVAHQLTIRLENFWEPDFSKTICTLCNQSFTWLKRKHHCRLCGKIFCGECSSFIFVVEHNFLTHRLRICKTCFESGNLNNFPFLV